MNIELLKRQLSKWFQDHFRKGYNRFLDCGAKIDACSLKERAVWFSIVMVLIVLFWYLIFFLPTTKTIISNRNQLKTIKNQVAELKNRYQELLDDKQMGKSQQRQSLLEQQLQKIEKESQEYMGRIIEYNELVDFMKSVLLRDSRLSLVEIRSLPRVAIVKVNVPNEAGLGQAAAQTSQPALYSQGLKIIFKGTYFETLRYLRSVEQAKWRLFWDSLSYEVTKYPEGNITLTVRALIHHKVDVTQNVGAV